MNFGFTEEQDMLRDQVRRFMSADCSLAQVRTLISNDQTPTSTEQRDALWQQMAQLGWLGLAVPEEHGGLGLKWVDQCVVLEETARGLSPLPLLSHYLCVTALALYATPTQRNQWLPKLADGSVRMSTALFDEPNWLDAKAITFPLQKVSGNTTGFSLSGTKHFVTDAAFATHILVACRATDGIKLALVEAGDIEIVTEPSIDNTKPISRLEFNNLAIEPDTLIALDEAQLEFLCDCGSLGVTAEAIGACEAALAMTNDYAKQRIQFGKPIGQYQGVKHRLADMYVAIESFKSLAYYAAWAADEEPSQLPRAASMAKAAASDAAAQIGIDCVGLHGAIGFTAEYDIQLYLKRSKWARPQFGDSDYHYQRVATLGGL